MRIDGNRLISFVIPCYNSAKTIEAVVEDVKRNVGSRDGYDCEFILVNDGSADNTYAVIKELALKNKEIVAVNFSKNYGQASALMEGYRHTVGSYVFSLDDDGQAPVESIYELIDKLEEGYDVVFGKFDEIRQTGFRNFGSEVNYRMTQFLLDQPKDVRPTSFWVGKKFLIDEIAKYDGPYPYVQGLILRITRKMANVNVRHKERQEGRSGYTLKKLLGLWLNGFTAFSIVPLRIATIVGLIFAGTGFIFSIITIIRKLTNPQLVLGYASTMVVMLFVGGIMMCMVGMLGEYVGRIYLSINNTPQSTVTEVIDGRTIQ